MGHTNTTIEWRDWSGASVTSNEKLLEKAKEIVNDLKDSNDYCWHYIIGDSFVGVSKRIDGGFSVFIGKVGGAAVIRIDGTS